MRPAARLAIAAILRGLLSPRIVGAAAPCAATPTSHPLITLPSSYADLYEKIYATSGQLPDGRSASYKTSPPVIM